MPPEPAKLDVSKLENGSWRLCLSGPLNSETTPEIWRLQETFLNKDAPRQVALDASGVTYCDGAGIGLVIELQRRLAATGGDVEIVSFPQEFRNLLEMYDPSNFKGTIKPKSETSHIVEGVGEAVANYLGALRTQVEFVGELSSGMAVALAKPFALRWREILRIAENAGANALPLVTLIGFLIGFIMAFQAAIPMKQFGAEIYVASLVSLTMFRELGALMTAIVLAGRSGSAFAAEIGTMKVNEELAALTTMGLDPVRFLVIPRVIAAVVMMPLLTIFANLAGLVGGAIVFISFGYPISAFIQQVMQFTSAGDFLGGLFKAFVFGVLVAAIGCYHGIQTKTGATAVGDSATRAVVGAIILVAITDSVFAFLFYLLGI